MVMLDLSAAFDTLDHQTLLQRFHDRFGITDTALDWFTSYFNNRKSRVILPDGVTSDETVLRFGVPQGSVIGPQAFTMYLSPIGDLLRQHEVKFHMYADDIQIYVEFDPKIPNDAECGLFKLSKCISDVQHWMSSNKLQLNEEKTEFFIASSSCNYKHLAHLTLTINSTLLVLSSTALCR